MSEEPQAETPQFGITYLQKPNMWFFQCTPEGKFIWNPDLITAFVNQVREEQVKQLEETFKIKGNINDKE